LDLPTSRSEEDNDPLTDDGASTVSVPVVRHAHLPANQRPSQQKPFSVSRAKHHLAGSILSDSDGVDSPTYDGDVESTAAVGPDSHTMPKASHLIHHHSSSSTSTLGTPFIALAPVPASSQATPNSEMTNPTAPPRSLKADSNHPIFIAAPLNVPEEPPVPTVSFDPAALTPEEIQAFVQRAIESESSKYKINQPPSGRPVRVYADGVYDLFHFGHALQLRQAKLSFSSVYLLVGVCSDELVRDHKAQGIMTHAERCEAARHCRWVDEVVPDAPWVIDDEFLKKYNIDYVAHDEDPYAAVGHDDVYSYVKSQGKFIPTRRTPGISTSELLERIVSGYRNRDFDEKLSKMGHAELRAEGSDFDEHSASSRWASRRASRTGSPVNSVS